MSHASRLLTTRLDYAHVKLLSSRMRNQAYGSQFAQLSTKKHHDIDLGACLGLHLSSNLHDVLAHLIIVPNGMSKARIHVHNSLPSSFTTTLVIVSKMSYTPSSHSVDSSHLTGFIVCDICNNHVINECIYAKIILAHKT
jgi:hypothetical protein